MVSLILGFLGHPSEGLQTVPRWHLCVGLADSSRPGGGKHYVTMVPSLHCFSDLERKKTQVQKMEVLRPILYSSPLAPHPRLCDPLLWGVGASRWAHRPAH